MGKRTTFGCALPDDLLEAIDLRRGPVPRTRYIELLIARALQAMDCPDYGGTDDASGRVEQ